MIKSPAFPFLFEPVLQCNANKQLPHLYTCYSNVSTFRLENRMLSITELLIFLRRRNAKEKNVTKIKKEKINNILLKYMFYIAMT